MLVSRRLKLLFSHVPKAGGSAVTQALRPWLDRKSHLQPEQRAWQAMLHEIGNNMHECWVNVEPEARPFLDDGFRHMAVHRSPWERVASLYQGIKGQGKLLEEFLTDGEAAWHLQQAVDVAGPEVDYWIRHAYLDPDFCYILGKLGFVADNMPSLPRLNVTNNKRPAAEVLTPRAIEVIIPEMFADDIREFGYTFDG